MKTLILGAAALAMTALPVAASAAPVTGNAAQSLSVASSARAGTATKRSSKVSVLALRDNVVPPTLNLETPDPKCDLDYTPLTAREHRTDTVLTVGSGFGGFQSAMIMTRGAQ